MLKAFKYKLNPSKNQARQLDHTLFLCRQLYNAALQERRDAYRKCRVSVTRFQQDKYLPEIKETLPEYTGVHSQVLQNVLKRLDKSFQAFFGRMKRGDTPGYPRFQGRNRFDSFCYPQYKTKPIDKHVYLPKIGNVRLRLSRPVEGKIKTCTVKREADGWYVVFVCEVEKRPLPKTGQSVGLDAGLTSVLATSDNEVFNAPKYFSKAQQALAKAQRRLARRKKGSKRREQARIQVAKLHQKVARQRSDFNHKLSRTIINRYDTIAFEDLNLKGLASGMLAKSFQDAGIGQLFNFITYKAENAGRDVKAVNPAYSSQTCPCCGNVHKKHLSERWHKCECGMEGNRDVIAAMVILQVSNAASTPLAFINRSLTPEQGWASPEWRNVSAVRLSVPLESHVF